MRKRLIKSEKLLLTSILLILCFFCSGIDIKAQSNPFQKVYGGASYDEGNAILQTDDHGFVIAGSSYSFGAGDYDSYLVKTDKDGNILWSKAYGTAGVDNFQDIAITADKGYLLGGSSSTTDIWGGVALAYFIVRTDQNGQALWAKQMPYNSNRVRQVLPTADGGFCLFGDDPYHIHFAKIDANGNTLFYNKYYLNGGIEQAGKVKPTPDGGYVFTGQSRNGASLYDLVLVKIDANGVLQWVKKCALPDGSMYASDLIVQSDGSFIIAGSAEGLASELMDVFLLKTDNNGTMQWVHTYGGDNEDKAKSLTPTCDGGYLLTGSSKSFKNNINDVYLIKTDADGVYKWSKVYGGHAIDAGTDVVAAEDCNFILTGNTQSYGAGLSDILFLKLNDTGNDQENCNNTSVTSNYGTHVLSFSPETSVYNDQSMIYAADVNITVTDALPLTAPSVCNECRKPLADFDYVQNKMSLNFLNYSENGTSYHWDMGNGTSDYMQSPVYEYESTGNYLVKLVVSNSCGKDSITKSVQVVNTNDCLYSIQPGPSRGQDASINNSPSNVRMNVSETPVLVLDRWTHDGVWDNWRSLIQFDLSSVCDVNHLLDSRLSLYYPIGYVNYLHNYTNEMFISRVTSSWNDHSVTWKTQPTITNDNRISIPSTPWGYELLNQDVYQMSKDMIAEGNHGFMLQMQQEVDMNYRAADYASSNFALPEKRPLLQLTYIPLNSSIVFTDTTICAGDSIQLAASGGVKYKWYPSEGLSCDNCPTPKASPSEATTYRVFIYNCENCAEVKKITVNIQANPNITDTTLVICEGNAVKLHANNCTNCIWTPAQWIDNTLGADPTAWPPVTTTYYVASLNTSAVCGIADSIKIEVQQPIPPSSMDTTICPDQAIVVQVKQPGAHYLWQDGTTNSLYAIRAPGTYQVLITNACGTTTQVYEVKNCCEDIKIPNLIIPNGDGMNDYFIIGCLGNGNWNVKIYNRWGSMVYENSNYQNNWNADGLADGVYYYSIHKKDRADYNGWVQVIR